MVFFKFVANRVLMKHETIPINTFPVFNVLCYKCEAVYSCGVSGEALFTIIMNGFNKTEAAIFPMQTMLPWNFPLFSD